MIRVSCPECGHTVKFRDEKQGKKTRCKECECVFVVSGSAPTAPQLPRRSTKKKRRKTSEGKNRRSPDTQQAEGFDKIYTIVRYVRWAAVLILPILFWIVSRRLHMHVVEGDGSVVLRPRGGGLIHMAKVMPYGGAAMFAVGLFGTLTFGLLVFAPESWLRKSSHGQFWHNVSNVESANAFRIVVALIGIAAFGLFFITTMSLIQGPFTNSPPLSWALSLSPADTVGNR